MADESRASLRLAGAAIDTRWLPLPSLPFIVFMNSLRMALFASSSPKFTMSTFTFSFLRRFLLLKNQIKIKIEATMNKTAGIIIDINSMLLLILKKS